MLLLARVSPTVFRAGDLRFFFFSREEARLHVHVECTLGEAGIWIEPRVEPARNHGLPPATLNRALRLVRNHEATIREAWRAHFGA